MLREATNKKARLTADGPPAALLHVVKRKRSNTIVVARFDFMANNSDLISLRYMCTTRERYHCSSGSSRYSAFPREGLAGHSESEGGKFRAAKFMAILLQRRCTCSNGWPPQVQERSRRRSQGDRSTFRSTVLHHKYSKRNVALRLLELVLLLLLLLLLEMLLFPGLPLLFLSLLPRATSSEYQSCTHRLPQHARLPASSPPRPTCAASS